MDNADPDRRGRIAKLNYDYAARPKADVQQCNLCGTRQFVILTYRDRYGFPAQANACRRCGLVFLNPLMTAGAYREFYESVYRPLVSAFHGRRIDAETLQHEQTAYAAELAAFLVPDLGDRGRGTLLDIGGSTGVIASHLAKRFGLAAAVLDPAPLEIHEATRLGLETIVAFVEEFDAGGRMFDLVTMCQTVDHLLDIAAALGKVRNAMDESGLFFVDIVDFRAAYLREWSVEDATKIDHPFYLTEATAEAYLMHHGFDILRKGYAPDRLHVRYLCRPGKAVPEYLPPASGAEVMMREVRYVQCTTREARL